jgi:hypothetical protein
MPYKVSKVDHGFRVTSPNHPQGFSKKPQTKKQAAIQAWIIQRSTGENAAGKKVAQPQKKIGVKRSK